MYINKIVLMSLILLSPQLTNADGLGLFDGAAALGFGVATKSAEKAVELDAEKRAIADPEHAQEIKSKAQVGIGVLRKADESLFNAAGIDVDLYKNRQIKTSGLGVGVYGKMLAEDDPGNGIALYTLPSKRWLDLQGFDVNKAVGIRVPPSIASQMIANESGQSFKVVITNDIKNLRDAFLNSGADAELLKTKIIQIMNFSNAVYADNLVKIR